MRLQILFFLIMALLMIPAVFSYSFPYDANKTVDENIASCIRGNWLPKEMCEYEVVDQVRDLNECGTSSNERLADRCSQRFASPEDYIAANLASQTKNPFLCRNIENSGARRICTKFTSTDLLEFVDIVAVLCLILITFIMYFIILPIKVFK